MWTIFVDNFSTIFVDKFFQCGQFLWTNFSVDNFCGHVDNFCGQFLWTIFVDNFLWTMWTVFVDKFFQCGQFFHPFIPLQYVDFMSNNWFILSSYVYTYCVHCCWC